MKVGIIGAGAGGYACTAYFTYLGHDVTLYNRKLDADVALKPIEKFGGISIIGNRALTNIPDFVPIDKNKLTTDIKKAVEGADIILNITPASGHEFYAKEVAPYVEDGQVITCYGKGGGALTYARVFRELGVDKDVYLSDTNTLPFGVSKMGFLGFDPNVIRIEAPTNNFILGGFPSKDLDKAYNLQKKLFPNYSIRRGKNVLETLLVDYNALTHPPPMICNAGRIEAGDRSFHLFGRDALTPAVVEMINALDLERKALSEKLSIPSHSLAEEVLIVGWNPPYGMYAKGKEDKVLPLYEALHTEYLEVCEGPFSLGVRQFTEDVPHGLVTYSSLGDMLGVETPVSDAIVNLTGAMLKTDFWAVGRTVEKLGINPKWSLDELNKFLDEGHV